MIVSVLLWLLLLSASTLLAALILVHDRTWQLYPRNRLLFFHRQMDLFPIPPYAIKISETDLNTILFITGTHYSILETGLQTFFIICFIWIGLARSVVNLLWVFSFSKSYLFFLVSFYKRESKFKHLH